MPEVQLSNDEVNIFTVPKVCGARKSSNARPPARRTNGHSRAVFLGKERSCSLVHWSRRITSHGRSPADRSCAGKSGYGTRRRRLRCRNQEYRGGEQKSSRLHYHFVEILFGK